MATIEQRDALTVDYLEMAETNLFSALQAMPNDVASWFEPASDSPRIQEALRLVRVTLLAVREQRRDA